MAYLELESVNKTYHKGAIKIFALRGVDLKIDKGEFVAIAGKSGSGKSTLLNIIGGLDRPDSGLLKVNGKKIQYTAKNDLSNHRRHTVGMIFQSFNLIPSMTALENVKFALIFGKYPRKRRHERAEELLSKIGLSHRLNHKPDELSGGEAQRVAIARALANNPAVLLADEPTGNLDSATSGELVQLLKELNEKNNLTIIIITHDLEIARNSADRIFTLHDGKLVKE